MTVIVAELRKKITRWLSEENPNASIELITNANAFFEIRLKDSSSGAASLPTYITLRKDNPDALFVSFKWLLHDSQIKSIAALKPETKKKFIKELSQGFLLMHMFLVTEPNIENIRKTSAIDQLIS